MEQSGIVRSVEGEYAKVQIKRATACESCSASHACLSCKKLAVVRCRNDAGAEPGDTVKLETPSSNVLLYAFCVFVFPIIVAFAAFIISSRFLDGNAPLFVAACGFAAAFAVVFFTVERRARKNGPVIVTGIEKKAADETAADTEK